MIDRAQAVRSKSARRGLPGQGAAGASVVASALVLALTLAAASRSSSEAVRNEPVLSPHEPHFALSASRVALPLPVPSAGATDGLTIVAATASASAEASWAPLFATPSDDLHSLILASAVTNLLPADFFLRLLRQESGLNPNAVSPAGALGIAQFMPGTAAERGLRNPFDPREAVPKSAELLREHQARFGNLGLAAAAYNAGPRRVQDWLSGRATMPMETRSYVLRITGRSLEDWVPPEFRSTANMAIPPNAIQALAPREGVEPTLLWPSASPRVLDVSSRKNSRTAGGHSHRALLREDRKTIPQSERGLCAALNKAGGACFVQAVY